MLGAALFHENDGFVRNNMMTKTHRRKMYAAMECESVEISGFQQNKNHLIVHVFLYHNQPRNY